MSKRENWKSRGSALEDYITCPDCGSFDPDYLKRQWAGDIKCECGTEYSWELVIQYRTMITKRKEWK